ncbi:mannan endo-1,4-beta-mannosidase [Trifolium repens]|nr:mannan endo-1,4-beta-mannosidase [Trifolium repens]
MEDAENTFPSSKKRAAEQELSRDTPHHNEKDSRYLATGTYRETVMRLSIFIIDTLEDGWGVFKTCNGICVDCCFYIICCS